MSAGGRRVVSLHPPYRGATHWNDAVRTGSSHYDSNDLVQTAASIRSISARTFESFCW